jgi:hypothetical protein
MKIFVISDFSQYTKLQDLPVGQANVVPVLRAVSG